jgi:hypothetical protein
MSDTKDLYSRINIYTPIAVDDCYSTGEVIVGAEDYSVDIDGQVQIYENDVTDIDHEVNIYESYSVDLDHQVVVAIPLSSDIDEQIQIYDADALDVDHQENIFVHQTTDIDEQVQIYENYETDIDHQVQIYENYRSLIDEQVRLKGLYRLSARQTIPAVVTSTDDLFSTAEVITQLDIDHQLVIYLPDETDIDYQVVIYLPDEIGIDHEVDIYEAYSADLDHQVVVCIPLSSDIDHQVQIYENLETDIDHQSQIFENGDIDIDEQVQIYEQLETDIDEQIHLVGFLLPAIGNVGLDDWYSDLPSEAEVITQLDIDHQVQIYEIYQTDIDHIEKIYMTDQIDIDHQVEIYTSPSIDLDHQVNIFTTPIVFDIDHQVKIRLAIPSPMFIVYEADESEIHDYTNRVENIGVIRKYLDKSFGITQVGNVDVVCENSDKAHTYLHPDGDFYPTSKYIWTWAKITCGWGVDLDQNLQAQFQGLVETLELTEARSCNFVIVDILKELIDGKLAAAITFDQNLVDTTPLESLNPIHIIEYLINEVLGAEVFDFSTETFVAACDPDSFDDAYTDCATIVVNDTTWAAESSIIEMIQDALKLVQGWIYTGGDGRIKAKVFTDPAPTGLEKHFIGSETDSDRKVMNLRLHPSRRDVINYVKWTYGQADNEYGPIVAAFSIAKYGYKPLELSTGWEVDTLVLSSVANEIMSRYVEPPDMITFATSNLYGSGDGLDAELGEVIKVTDDGIGIDGAYFRIIEKRDDLLGRKSEIVAEEYVGT